MNQLTQQTMTIKELAEVAGCSTKTINRILKVNFPEMLKKGRTTRFTKAECFDIMAFLPKQNDLGQPRTSEGKVVQGSDARLDQMQQSINSLIGIMGEFIKSQTAKKEEPKQLPPKLEPRDEIRKIINSYCHHTGTTQNVCWNLLYQECYYTLHRNFRLVGQNRTPKVSGVDIAEEEGFIFDMLLVARNIFQLGRS